ncbi:cilia- and flagella-associated protein 206 isoform X1 [Sphaerodactylus townsendi]|uniref:cilia- and flagella-associated protein 206 isoform X1 n=1 Tax=Sphaerodactylus townsendi TaxID=933632 RepID=UPI0020275960|nr:cilia- and flagella-associated protein 206 isoform X1 [Sphaerodactylus townsendi]
MTHSQAENVIKNIIREIGQECAMKGQTVSETLVAFMVKVVVLDPRNGFNVDRTLTKADVQKLIKLCIERLLDTRNPSLDTIKMQVYFDMNYSSRVDLINEQHRILESRLAPVGREITDNRARTREELESVYRKMVSYVLLRSGLGSPTDIKVIREATAALQSVFPQTELAVFLSLNKKEKERHLKELTMIVTGIRLFNKDCGKGGEGIDDLPAILNEAIPAATHHIEIELQTSQDLAYRYTAIIETMHQSLNAEMELKLTMLKEVLYNVRQHEAYLCVILSDVITCSQEIDMMQKQLAAQMEQLKDVVRAKTAVPTSQVYPSFITLSNLWTSFQDEILVLSFLNNLTVNLQQFLNAHAVIFPEDVMESLLEGIRVKTDDERLKESADDKVNVSDFTSEEWLFPETTINFSQLIVQYHGFCAYSFAVKDGLLVPGNPSLGILKHKEKYYTFCSRESAYCFARNPDKYIKMIGDKAKESPELIQLLELHHQFESLAPYSQIKSKDKSLKPITKCDSSTQTDTHILPPTIVKDYEWNEWELRRKAIKLANLRQKLTHSVQTNLSHMRRDNSAQVYLMKDSSTQTKRESSSNVPRPQIFLAGLRGGTPPITRMTKVNLTRAVDET